MAKGTKKQTIINQTLMKIQIVTRPSNGCDYFRCVLPAIYLQKDVEWSAKNSIELLWIAQGEMKIDCNILIYNKLIGTSIDRLKHLQKQGMKIVVDVDDMWDLPKGHAHYEQWNGSGNHTLTIEHMKIADLVTCTSMRLQEAIRPYNKNTVVIPNALPFGEGIYQPTTREPYDKLRFLYAGGVSHLPDVELLRFPFKKVGSTLYVKGDSFIRNNAEFIIAGYDQISQKVYRSKEDHDKLNDNYTIQTIPGPYDDMVSIFKQTGKHKVVPTTHVTQYIKCYDQADVALAPLRDTSWNSYKSTLKVLEAASRNIPIICSNVPPYSDLRPCEGIMFIEREGDWLDYFRYCIKNPEFVKDMGYKLSDWIREEYSLQLWNQTRKQLYDNLVSK